MACIAHISDVHFGAHEDARVDAVVEAVNAARPTLTVLSGDLTQRARSDQYRQAVAFIDRLPAPRIVVPGNHDIPLWNVWDRFMHPLRNYKTLVTAEMWPEYEDDELYVLGVNSARSLTGRYDGFWKDGRVSREQIAEIRRRFTERSGKKFKVVVTHHPFVPPPGESKHKTVHNAAAALEALAQLDVDVVLAGHLHESYSGDVRTHHETLKRGILSIQAGTACSTRTRGERNAFNLLDLAGDTATLRVLSLEEGRFVEESPQHFERSEAGWQPRSPARAT
ncbi:MAG: metallophosphoesterase family protein [Phycisphaerae bacterium]